MLFGNTKPEVFLFQVVKKEMSNNSPYCYNSSRKIRYFVDFD